MKRLILVSFVFGVMSLALGAASSKALASDRSDQRREALRNDSGWQQRSWSRRADVQYQGRTYVYHEGRFYKPGLFGYILDLVPPPRGIVVAYLPTGYRTIIVGKTIYYEHENVYYESTSEGYTVVEPPVVVNQCALAPVVYAPEVSYAQAQPYHGGGTVIVNVPTRTRGAIGITLIIKSNGFIGPQGEFYSTFPATEELSARYGR
jgi:hypothetical protein